MVVGNSGYGSDALVERSERMIIWLRCSAPIQKSMVVILSGTRKERERYIYPTLLSLLPNVYEL